ncbi:hypothetical protein [Cerasicoccus maritimus]|uniref:hypothetical protein n=1 Tax=Cerasicoccus maritimus TaxID=490089 RepID=UPI0028527218|nr:hypothetical protein [Cerasicoccus maritimus]
MTTTSQFKDTYSDLQLSFCSNGSEIDMLISGIWSESSSGVLEFLSQLADRDFSRIHIDVKDLEYHWGTGTMKFLISNYWRKGNVEIVVSADMPQWLQVFSLSFTGRSLPSIKHELIFKYGDRIWNVLEIPPKEDFPWFWSAMGRDEWLRSKIVMHNQKLEKCPNCGRNIFGPLGSCSYCGDYY